MDEDFVVEGYVLLLAVVVEGVHDCSACSVGDVAGSFDGGFTEVFGVSAESALLNLALSVSAEWYAKMLQRIDCIGGFFS